MVDDRGDDPTGRLQERKIGRERTKGGGKGDTLESRALPDHPLWGEKGSK